MDFYTNYGYKEVCQDIPIAFPPQHQDVQPGMEYLMNPLPIFDNPNYISSGKLKDKIAVITGGDSGIGRAVSVLFAKEGADIVIVYYNEHRDALDTKNIVEALGRRCLLISGDLANDAFCNDVVNQTIDNFGRIDILVNNAGVQYPQLNFLDISNEQLYRTFKVNILSFFYLTKAALPHMRKGSAIINTTSITAYNGEKYLIDYSATKGAIVGFTRSLALALVTEGIRVNAVAPGPIWTPLQPASWWPEHIETFGIDTPMRRAGQPVELAPAYLYLASEDSSYVTGQVLHVDGGGSTAS